MPQKKKVEKKPAKMGRPLVQIDWVQFDKLCFLHCSLYEIAGFFECDPKTIQNAVKREHGLTFSQYWQMKSAHGKIGLRRMQYQLAEAGDSAMARHLGAYWLGQTPASMEHESGSDRQAKLDEHRAIVERLLTGKIEEIESNLVEGEFEECDD